MAGIYKIGTKLGYDLANGMKAGESVTATDGSVWTKGDDGTISVLHNGQTLTGQITYQPTNQEAVKTMPGSTGYESPYASQIQAEINNLNNSQWSGWDKDNDESYQAYRKEYLREADRTMQDTLGQYAQNTGGIAGSSAIAAASQAADYYKAQLADKVPELYENAYGRYLNELQQKQNAISLMMSAEDQAQSGYYQKISYALNKWAQMGYADQEVAGILGVTAGTPTSDQSYTDWSTAFQQEQFDYEKEQAAAASAAGSGSGYSGGSGGGSSSGSGSGGNTGTEQDYSGLFAAAYASGNPKSFLANNYKRFGFTSSTGLYDDYQNWMDSKLESGQQTQASGTSVEDPYPHFLNLAKNIFYNNLDKGPQYLYQELKQQGLNDDMIDAIMANIGL